jgi:uncharacterized protein (DUF302 family)
MVTSGMASENGVVSVKSAQSFPETCRRLELLIKLRNLIVFDDIDFERDAERAGLMMWPARLFIFGSPAAGTPLMQAAPTSALDFPLKVLVTQDLSGDVWLRYNSPEYLAQRHGIPANLLKNISGIRGLVERAGGPDPVEG